MKTPISRPTLQAVFVAVAVSFGSFTSLSAMAATATGASPFAVVSEAGPDGTMPNAYTCDGAGATPALAWSNPPAGTQEFALLMTTVPPDGVTK